MVARRHELRRHGPQDEGCDVFTVKTDGADPVRLTSDYDAVGAAWG
jgi:hypothetical protein